MHSDPTVGRVGGVVARQGVNKHEQIEKRIRATKKGRKRGGVACERVVREGFHCISIIPLVCKEVWGTQKCFS